MKKIVKYNKLIRDKIPEIVRKDGWIPKLRTLNKKEFEKELKKKVLEEAKELVKAKDKEELINEIVDIQEIVDSLIGESNLTKSEIRKRQQAKNKKRGGFKKQLFLIEEEKQIGQNGDR